MSKEQEDNKIGLGVATVIGMNAMIGAGVVAMPAMLSANVGPAGVFSYVIAICLALLIGLSLARLAELYSGSGWSYLYPSKWGGHKFGMFSAICYLGGVMIAMGFLVQQAGVWSAGFFPSSFSVTHPYLTNPKILGSSILTVLTLLVIAGAEASSIVQYMIAACVLGPLLITATLCWFKFDLNIAKVFMPYGFMPVLATAPKALFTLLGFESIASLYTIVRNPKRNVPRACVMSIMCVGSLYIFFAAAILFSIPGSYFVKGVEESLASVILYVFPAYRFISTFVLIGAMAAIIGTLHSMIWSISALFTDVLKRSRSKVVKNALDKGIWNTTVSVIVTASAMLFTSLYIHAESILLSTVFFIAIAYGLSIATLLLEKSEWDSGRNYGTLVAVLGVLIIMYYSSAPLVGMLRMVKDLII